MSRRPAVPPTVRSFPAGTAILRCLAMATGVALAQGASANLVTNGSFESGNFNGWTVTNAGQGSNLALFDTGAFDGTYFASFSASSGQYDSIEQLLATTAGQEYEVTLWVQNFGIELDSLRVDWEGSTALFLEPVGTGLESWEKITFNVIALQNGSSFAIRGFDGQAAFGLDAISVVAVPGPSAAILFLSFVRRSRSRSRRD